MKKLTFIFIMIIALSLTGCKGMPKKSHYPPEAENNTAYTVGGEDIHQGEGYTIAVPSKDYRFEKDFDDGAFEETWEYKKKDDVEIKVTTYQKTDEITARERFLRENRDYIFEDLMGYPLCGEERDGDTLWFSAYVSGETVYIVSWEYPKNTKDDLKTELANIAETFAVAVFC